MANLPTQRHHNNKLIHHQSVFLPKAAVQLEHCRRSPRREDQEQIISIQLLEEN
ncbi:hypothetical protein [Chroococcidiopsis sp. TS-821]|uniref:hypothetical protein n=1 Tax=Chroococcidiopsis sp. TS-821 TaxID=1378066 RepID=UPI00143DA71C|nr:hypothetical protein [Chroococcidiopsis sp. TS-821]